MRSKNNKSMTLKIGQLLLQKMPLNSIKSHTKLYTLFNQKGGKIWQPNKLFYWAINSKQEIVLVGAG